jgi:hypothetical protein
LSRPRSGRAASSGGGGSRPAARPGVFVQTPKSDIYVALLGISLGAMILGCILLLLILNGYEFKTKVSALTAPPSTGLALTCDRAAEKFLTVPL